MFRMAARNGHGGARSGAGRPRGARNRRSRELADNLLGAGKCPAEALIRIAERAEADGNLGLALDAWKAVLPFVHARPKPVELVPEEVLELARSLAQVRQEVDAAADGSYLDALREAVRKAESGDLTGDVK